MIVNLGRNLITLALASIALFAIAIPAVWAEGAEDFVAKLRSHYKKAPSLEVYALNYHYLGERNPYSARDYQSPERYMALRLVEIDLVKKHFVENDIHHFPDGLTFNRIQFQNDTESLFYDKNGLSLGKRIINQGLDTFEEFSSQNFMNLDFLAVKPLLEESNIATNVTLSNDKNSGQITLTHQVSDESIVDYVFSDSPLQLMSIDKKLQQEIFVYDDYRTTNGITFARSILKYYDGATKPSFIHRIDQLHILDEIDPVRFQVPKEFGPIIPESDRTLVSEEIAPNLYLVSSASASRNILFKVDDDEIMIFGGTASPELTEETIDLILSQFPKSKITSVYVTHPHTGNIGGLSAYARRGITIQADAYSIAAIKAYPPFANNIAEFKFQTIEHKQIINGARFYVLESSHSKRQGFVYFKDSGIIFQADFLIVAFDNTIAKVVPGFNKTFIDFVRGQQLKFNRIVGYRLNNNITTEVMDKIDNAY
jgi:hypothetical protein